MENQDHSPNVSKRSALLSFMTFALGLVVLGLYQNCGPTDPYGSEGQDSLRLDVILDTANIKLSEYTDADTYPKVEIPILNRGGEVTKDLTLNVLATVDSETAVPIKYDITSESLNGLDRKTVVIVDCYNVRLNCTFQNNSFLSLTINLDGVQGADFAQKKFNLKTGQEVEDDGSSPGGSDPNATAPAAPSTIEASSNATKIIVTWTAPDNGGSSIIRYEVERQRRGFLGFYFSQGITTAQGGTSLEVSSGIQSSTFYRFRVRAVNAVGSGDWSNYTPDISLQ